MLLERSLDYLLSDDCLLATVRLTPTGNVDAAHSEQTVHVRYKDAFTGRRLVAVAHEAKLRCFRRHLAEGRSAPDDGPHVTFEDFKAALDAEARTVQNCLRRAEDLPEHVPGCISRDMVPRVKHIDLPEIG